MNALQSHWFASGVLAVLSCLASANCSFAEQEGVAPIANLALTQPDDMLLWGEGWGGIFAVGRNYMLYRWSWQKGSLREFGQSQLPQILDIAPLPESGYLATTAPHERSRDSSLVIASVAATQASAEWVPPKDWMYRQIGVSGNGKHGAVLLEQWMGNGLKIGIVDVAASQLKWTVEMAKPDVLLPSGIAITDDGQHVAVAGWNHGVAVFDVKTKKNLWTGRPAGMVRARGVCFSLDGSKLFFGDGGGGNVFAVDTITGKMIHKYSVDIEGHGGRHGITCMSLSSDGTLLAMGTAPGGLILVYDTADDDKRITLTGARGRAWAISFSPDSKKVAGLAGGSLLVWKVRE